jgi:hypothetical protein
VLAASRFPASEQRATTLAQHDWIHVLADYGSTVGTEIEVFASSPAPTAIPPRSRCTDSPRSVFRPYMRRGFFE